MGNNFGEDVAAGLVVNAFTAIAKATYRAIRGIPTDDAEATALESEWREAAVRYERQLHAELGQVRILEMPRGVSLPTLFVRPRLTRDITRHSGATSQSLDDDIAAGIMTKGPALDGLKQVVPGAKLVLLGRPGAGKTTFLNFAALRQFDAPHDGQLPIHVSLREIGLTEQPLQDALEEQFRRAGLRRSAEFVSAGLATGRFLVLCDGLDEVPSSQLERVCAEIDRLVLACPNITCLVTCRDGAYDYWLRDFVLLELLPFTTQQVSEFVEKWFADDPRTARRCLDQLTRSDRVQDLVSVPLLAALLCISFEATREVPMYKASFFDDALDVLLRRWDAGRRIDRVEPGRSIGRARVRELLSALAYELVVTEKYSWTRNALAASVERFFTSRRRRGDVRELDAFDVIRQLEAQHGLLVRRARAFFGFAHVGFLEFLAAEFIARVPDEAHAFATKRLLDERTREVIAFLPAKLADPDSFVRRVIDEAERLYGLERIGEAVRLTVRRFEDAGTYSPKLTRWYGLSETLMRLAPFADSIDEILRQAREVGPHMRFLVALGKRCDPGLPEVAINLRPASGRFGLKSTLEASTDGAIRWEQRVNVMTALRRAGRLKRGLDGRYKKLDYLPFHEGSTLDDLAPLPDVAWVDNSVRDVLDGRDSDSALYRSLTHTLADVIELGRLIDGYLRTRMLALECVTSTPNVSEALFEAVMQRCAADADRLTAIATGR